MINKINNKTIKKKEEKNQKCTVHNCHTVATANQFQFVQIIRIQ